MSVDENYEFEIMHHKESGEPYGVKLSDETIIFLNGAGLSLGLPKKVYSKLLSENLQEDSEYFHITFSPEEVMAFVSIFDQEEEQ